MKEELNNIMQKMHKLDGRMIKLKAQYKDKLSQYEDKRKIVAGTALLQLVEKGGGDLATERVWNACLQRMSERDRSLF